jgi:4-hydroxybenzoate polyprenyltransferase
MKAVKTIVPYISLVKFSHTIFALPFALIGYFLALKKTGTGFQILLLVKVILCMVFARNAAMAFNRYIDRHYDGMNPRTKVREIPSGIIGAKSAFLFVLLNVGLFMFTCFTINNLCFYLSPVAMGVVIGYSYTKRFTAFCHFVLGLGLALAPIGAYLAVTGAFALLPILFSLAVLCWVTGFDIIYALQDEAFDKSIQLKSIPVVLGGRKALFASSLLHVFAALFILVAGQYGHFNFFYWIGAMVFCSLLVYQHTLVKPNDLSKVNQAFFLTNGIASVVFALFVLLSFY